MTVTISKPAVNLREELSALKKPTGIKGEELLRANTVADVYTSLNSTMFRNRLINGDMRIWQRGVTTTPGSGYSADMFRFEPRNSTTIYSDRSTDVPVGQGFSYSMRTYATGATDDGFHIRTYVELPASGVYGEFQPGTQWTVSFWMKSAYASRTINVTVGLAETAVGGSHQSQGVTSMQGTQFVTNQWQKYVFNFTLPSWVADTGSLSNVRCLYVRLLQGSDDLPQDTYVTGVQLEKGAVATPFEIRPIGAELDLCQRYFQKLTAQAVGFQPEGNSGQNGRQIWAFPVTMRAAPSASNISVTYRQSASTYTASSVNCTTTIDGLSEFFATASTNPSYTYPVCLLYSTLYLSAEL
jgi:hypothetical protein